MVMGSTLGKDMSQESNGTITMSREAYRKLRDELTIGDLIQIPAGRRQARDGASGGDLPPPKRACTCTVGTQTEQQQVSLAVQTDAVFPPERSAWDAEATANAMAAPAAARTMSGSARARGRPPEWGQEEQQEEDVAGPEQEPSPGVAEYFSMPFPAGGAAAAVTVTTPELAPGGLLQLGDRYTTAASETGRQKTQPQWLMPPPPAASFRSRARSCPDGGSRRGAGRPPIESRLLTTPLPPVTAPAGLEEEGDAPVPTARIEPMYDERGSQAETVVTAMSSFLALHRRRNEMANLLQCELPCAL